LLLCLQQAAELKRVEADVLALLSGTKILHSCALSPVFCLVFIPIATTVLRGKWTKMLTARSFDKEKVAFQSRVEVAEGNSHRAGHGKDLQLNLFCTTFLSL
jgi:hypothetical protein